mgnify:CR=1 FL=1|tara:strand:- start:269 stop:556 length:288 start_codon:yes stop_codon:yes gene_type:complete
MTVLNVATTHLKDADKMQAYIDAAAPLMKEYGAEVVVRGHYLKSLLGESKRNHILGVFRFQDMETADAFYECDEYKRIVNLRDQAGEMTFSFYEE